MKNCTNCYWGVRDMENKGEWKCLANDGQHALSVNCSEITIANPCPDWDRCKK